MGLIQRLRGMWRRHDEKLAEQAYKDRDSFFQQQDERPLIHHPGTDRVVGEALRAEDTLQHEGPSK